MTLAVLNLLGHAGGNTEPEFTANSLVINEEPNTTLYVYGDDDMECVYSSKGATRKQVIDWSPWLGSSTISSIAWSSVPSSDITFANTSTTNQSSTAFISGGSNGNRYLITAKCTTADSPAEVENRSFYLVVDTKWA